MTTFIAKCAAVAKVFGEVDRDDPSFVDFLYARRRCATVPESGRRELSYIYELQDLEHAIWQALYRIKQRDGEAIYREAATYLRKASDKPKPSKKG
jgi:hypothetical protein